MAAAWRSRPAELLRPLRNGSAPCSAAADAPTSSVDSDPGRRTTAAERLRLLWPLPSRLVLLLALSLLRVLLRLFLGVLFVLVVVLVVLWLSAGLLWGFDKWQTARGTRPPARDPVRFGWLYLLGLIGAISHDHQPGG